MRSIISDTQIGCQSDSLLPAISVVLNNAEMKTIEEIRRENLSALRRMAGSIRQLADQTGVSENQISQWINASKESKTGKPRGMSSTACRKFEEELNLEKGWMDHEHGIGSRKSLARPEMDEWTARVIEMMTAMPEASRAAAYGTVLMVFNDLGDKKNRRNGSNN